MLRLEHALGQKLELYPIDDDEIALLTERVDEAGKAAANQLRDEEKVKGATGKRRQRVDRADDNDRDDDVVEVGMPRGSFKRKRRT